MSEVDRLSNSGLYPALPIQDRQRGKDESSEKPPPAPRGAKPQPQAADQSEPNPPRPPKSIIDDYA